MAEETSTFMRDLAAGTAGDRAAAERNAAWRAGAEHVAAEALRLISRTPDNVNEYVMPDALREVLRPFAAGHPEDIYGDGYRRGVQEACKEFRLQYRIYEGRPAPVVREFGKFCAIALEDV